MSNGEVQKYLNETAGALRSNWNGNYFEKSGPLLDAQPCPSCKAATTQQLMTHVYGLNNGEIRAHVDLPNSTSYWFAKEIDKVAEWIEALKINYEG